MRPHSNDLDDLERDIRNLAVLIDTIVGAALNIASHDAEQKRIGALLWIARDVSEDLVGTIAACHQQVIAERRKQSSRMTGGARS